MFEWITPPDVLNDGMANYVQVSLDTLYDLCVEFAARIEKFMRENAPWNDDCMPTREYLRAEAYRIDTQEVGIRAWYDLELYRKQCGEPPFDWGARHETMTFSHAGVISIILPRSFAKTQTSVLGQLADELWDRVRALYS